MFELNKLHIFIICKIIFCSNSQKSTTDVSFLSLTKTVGDKNIETLFPLNFGQTLFHTTVEFTVEF